MSEERAGQVRQLGHDLLHVLRGDRARRRPAAKRGALRLHDGDLVARAVAGSACGSASRSGP